MKSKAWLLSLVVLVWSCQSPNSTFSHKTDDSWEPIPVLYAYGFRLWQQDNIYRVEIRNPQDTSAVWQELILVRSPAEAPNQLQIPISKVALGSTTFIPYFSKLDQLDRIAGCTYLQLIGSEAGRADATQLNWLELAPGGELDLERVVSISPDVLLTYLPADIESGVFKESQIQPILHLEYLESHPLARAEWLLLVGCLTDQLIAAQALFDSIASRYLELKLHSALSSTIPTVVIGSKYSERWYAPGGESYLAKMLHDASAKYAFEHLSGAGSQELDYEVVYSALSQADFWGAVLSDNQPITAAILTDGDQKLTQLSESKAAQIFVCNTAQVDYFGEAVLEPDVVLADLIRIFRPNYLPEHQPKYFRVVP